jgi:hypothetical protein
MSATSLMLLAPLVAATTVAGLPAHRRQLQADCSGAVSLTDSGALSDGAGNYPDGQSCTWALRCQYGGTAQLEFTTVRARPGRLSTISVFP